MNDAPIRSMTGYGYLETQNDKYHLLIEIKSYNNRYLDVTVNSSSIVASLEPKIRGLLSSRIARGRIEATVKIRELEEDITIHLDKAALSSYLSTYAELLKEARLDDAVQLSHLIANEDILKKTKHRDADELWALLNPLLEKVIESYNETRIREGRALAEDITSQLTRFETGLSLVEQYAEKMEASIRETLEQKLKTIFAEPGDEARIMTEIAMLLVKYSVNEEIVRTRGHLIAFRGDLSAQGRLEPAHGIGKKLDFICQELGREINTIASKSTILEVNQAVVNMKDALENIREQLRNVE